jgi:Fe-S cluster biosynthesis and repair protein YggX
MPRLVHCVKLGREAEGLDKPPLKGDVGKKIFENISKEAWRAWLEHSKILVNEYRLDLMSESGQRVWMSELDKYFWGEGAALPKEFVPEAGKHDHAHGHDHDHDHDHGHGHDHAHDEKKT